MKDEDKLRLADMIITFVQERATPDETPVLVGTLTQPQGIHGFKRCDVGHPIFEYKNRYILYMESNDGKTTISVPYYKESFTAIQLL